MRGLLSVLIGLPIWVGIVLNPLRSILITRLAVSGFGDTGRAVVLLTEAYYINPYDKKILYMIGDIAAKEKKYDPGLWAYSTIMKLSPTDSAARIKYGEALLNLGYDGLFAIKEALYLEPNNPLYKAEVERVSELLKVNNMKKK